MTGYQSQLKSSQKSATQGYISFHVLFTFAGEMTASLPTHLSNKIHVTCCVTLIRA